MALVLDYKLTKGSNEDLGGILNDHPLYLHCEAMVKSAGVEAVVGTTEKFTLKGPTSPKFLRRGSMRTVSVSSVSMTRGGVNSTSPCGLSLAVMMMST